MNFPRNGIFSNFICSPADDPGTYLNQILQAFRPESRFGHVKLTNWYYPLDASLTSWPRPCPNWLLEHGRLLKSNTIRNCRATLKLLNPLLELSASRTSISVTFGWIPKAHAKALEQSAKLVHG